MKEIPVVDIKITDLGRLYQKGYNILEESRHEAGAPAVKAKIFSEEAIMIYGSSAAKVFYDPRSFERKSAMPKSVLKTLSGQDGVQTLDGVAYHHRKNIFMDLMTPKRMEDYHRVSDRDLT